MKIFAIRDKSAQEQKDLAYLLYYEQEKRFYIELPENADADWRIRRCLECEHDCFGYDALPDWEKCPTDDGGFPELCRSQSRQRIGSSGIIGLLPAEHH